MAVYAQHGHGKGERLDIGLDAGILDGVILGARNEPEDKVAECVSSLSSKGDVLFDPQYFLSTFAPPNDRYLPEYSYYKSGLSAASFTGAKKLNEICKSVIDFQVALGTDRILSPTVFCDNFETKWGQTALNLADTSLEYYSGLSGAPPLLLSFLIAEPALTSKKETESFLDQVTAWEATGVYLTIAREDSTYSQGFDPQRLANILYLNYVFGEVNGFEVVNGFSDFCGLLYRSVGSKAFGTGWYQGLRQYNKKSFIKSKPGGGVARLRYSSGPLLNSIFISELDQIRDIGLLEEVLSGTDYDASLSANSDQWTQRQSEYAHWQTLSDLDRVLPKMVSKRLTLMDSKIDSALKLYYELEEAGVVLGNTTGPDHLTNWTDALKMFRGLIGKP